MVEALTELCPTGWLLNLLSNIHFWSVVSKSVVSNCFINPVTYCQDHSLILLTTSMDDGVHCWICDKLKTAYFHMKSHFR